MKKLKTLSFALLVGVLLVSCKPSVEDARKYNDDLIAIEKNLSATETEYLNIAFSDSTKAQKTAVYEKVVKEANDALATVDKMEAFDGSSDYKDAGKAYFTAIKGLCDNEYKEALALITIEGRDLTEEENAKLDAVATAIDTKTADALKKIQDAQMIFAAKYKVEIEETAPAETK